MKKNRIKVIILLFIIGFTFYCFIVQPEILTVPLAKSPDFPFGTLISWGGLVAYVLLIQMFVVSTTKSLLSTVIKTAKRTNLLLLLLWLPVGWSLSGNLAFNFQNRPIAFKIWIFYTVLIVLIPLVLILLKLIGMSVKSK